MACVKCTTHAIRNATSNSQRVLQLLMGSVPLLAAVERLCSSLRNIAWLIVYGGHCQQV